MSMCVKRKKWVCHVRACEGERLRERVRACLRRPWCVSDSTWLVQENEGGKNILSKLNRLSVPSLPPLSLPLPLSLRERKREREKCGGQTLYVGSLLLQYLPHGWLQIEMMLRTHWEWELISNASTETHVGGQTLAWVQIPKYELLI